MIKFKIIKNKTDYAKEIEKRLKQNGNYCPCAIVKNKDTKCMCKAFREMTEESECFCGLYKKVIVK